MSKSNLMKLGIVSMSAGLILAACDTDDSDTTPMQEETTENTEPLEETPADDSTGDNGEGEVGEETPQTDSPGIENMEFSITLDNALEIFYETFGSEEINIDQIDFDDDNGRYLYEISGWDGEFEYELDIDAETGEVVQQEQEQDTETNDILDLAGLITPSEAMEIALEASGAGYVEEWQLELENGQTFFDVDIENGTDQKVNAQTGELR